MAAVDYMAHGMCTSPSILQTGTGSIAPAIKAFCDRVHIPAKQEENPSTEPAAGLPSLHFLVASEISELICLLSRSI